MYGNLYFFPLPLAVTVFATAELCVPHLPEQKPVTVTSAAVNTILTAFGDATIEASLARWLSVNDFPREYFGSDTCLPSRVDTEAGLDNLVWYFSVIFHHVATEGCWAWELYDNEVMKSEIMAFWDGLKLPYHIRFTEIFPARRGPLCYGFCSTRAVGHASGGAKSETATSFAVNTMLTVFGDAPFEASLARCVSLNDLPKEYFVSNTCLPSLVDNEACLDDLDNLLWYFSVVFHHVATDGWCSDLDDNEVMKYKIMAFWDGLKLPYHIRLIEILPVRSWPLWYLSWFGESLTNSDGSDNVIKSDIPVSYANRLNDEPSKKVANNCLLIAPASNGVDVVGKRVVYQVVENYVKNACSRFGLVCTMMKSKGVFFFKFSSNARMESMLENGPWLIRYVPLILCKWSRLANVSN
ncbi:zinc knuckle CX2CX4HX4C containing protein [Tanacetum coccineum]